MTALIIASTAAGAGRTSLAASLAARIARNGRKVGLIKAFTGSADDPDARSFQQLVPQGKRIPPTSISGVQPSSAQQREFAAAAGKLSEVCDALIIEGLAAAPAVNLAIAEALDGHIVHVDSMADAVDVKPAAYGGRLAGVVINPVPRYREYSLHHETLPALERAGVPFLGWVPEDRRLVALSVRTIAEHLDGEFIEWEEHADRLVDNLLIGGMVLDWGPSYFGSKDNVAVFVRGDRPDLQMAALQTENETVRALFLTKNIKPIEYVYYEADQVEVPVVVVPTDTHETAARLETVLERSRFDHPEKLARFLELAEGRLDLATIEAVLAEPATR